MDQRVISKRERQLKQILKLQSEIRKQHEQRRRVNTSQNERYTRIFKPVTSSIKKLMPPENILDHPVPKTVAPLMPNENILDQPVPQTDAPVLIPDIKEEKFYEEPNNDIYRQALIEVPENLRSDGILGLNTRTHSIGEYEYEVKGDILHCIRVDGSDGHLMDRVEFKIGSLNLWMLLLVKNPTRIELKLKAGREYSPFVYDFKDIVDRLGLAASGRRTIGYNLRKKAKTLAELEKAGSGFLFTSAPPNLVKSNTFIIPSDKDGLMHELYTALAELRAGNTSMQNIVVPLAAEAQRLGYLSKDLLTPEEQTWMYA